MTTIRSASEIPKAMPKSEQEWCLLCLMESGSATYDTVATEEGGQLLLCTSDRREERWGRNNNR